jgi:6-phosphogluconolactonase (cycloisomerase 2 family)
MKRRIKSFGLSVLMTASALALGVPAQPAHAQTASGGALFVQTNDPAQNAIDAYRRNPDGTLTFAHSYRTGGAGGREVGSMSDPLASMGSLVRVPGTELLLAVNAGSNTISVFHVNGDQLELAQVLPSFGPFPVGFGMHGDLVYVLDAGGAGFISGYRVHGNAIHPIARSTRSLGLGNTTPPFFLSSPAEVGFTPSGTQLVVTTKTNSTVDVFAIGSDGRPSAAPVKNPAAGVPFAFVFDPGGRLILNFAGTSSLQTFTVRGDGTIAPAGEPASDGQAAACWITPADGYDYVSNTGSNDVSQYQVASDGTVVLVNPVAASSIPGATDSRSAGDFLYVQSGLSSTVHVFEIGTGGALTPVHIASVPDGGSQEGIAVG